MNKFIIPELKVPNKQWLKKKMKMYVSDQDITRILGPKAYDHIIKYSKLQNYKSIDQLLKGPKDFRIILIESEINSGHWIAILRDRNIIEVFNLYGTPISAELNVLTERQKQILRENQKWLNILLTKGLNKFNIIYNNVDFQKESNIINTCGRHCLTRICTFFIQNFSLQQYIDFIKANSTFYRITPDELVSILI
jgi:hypothetical protein